MEMSKQNVNGSSRLKRILPGIAVITLFWILFFLMADPMSAAKVEKICFKNSIMDESAGMGVGPLFSADKEISQSFVSENNGLKAVEFYFATKFR